MSDEHPSRLSVARAQARDRESSSHGVSQNSPVRRGQEGGAARLRGAEGAFVEIAPQAAEGSAPTDSIAQTKSASTKNARRSPPCPAAPSAPWKRVFGLSLCDSHNTQKSWGAPL